MITKDLGAVTAYAYAVEGGYTGTEEEFTQLMADLGITVDEFEHFSVSVSTLPAGSSATASYADGVLSLGIPKGDKGDTGETPDLSIGTVTTLSAGADATATITGTAENPVLNLGLPKGADGSLASGVLASTYSTSKTYAVGDYVYYSGNLYRCTTAITTAEAWTSAHWTQVALADDVSDLKSDLTSMQLLDSKKLFDWAIGGWGINGSDEANFSNGSALKKRRCCPHTLTFNKDVTFILNNPSGLYRMCFYTFADYSTSKIPAVQSPWITTQFTIKKNTEFSFAVSWVNESSSSDTTILYNELYEALSIIALGDANDLRIKEAKLGDDLGIQYIYPTFNMGYIKGDGSVASSSGYNYSDKISVNEGDIVRVKSDGSGYCVIALYRSDDTLVSTVMWASGKTDYELEVSTNGYVRTCSSNSYADYSVKIFKADGFCVKVETEIDDIANAQAKSDRGIKNVVDLKFNYDWVVGGWWANGTSNPPNYSATAGTAEQRIASKSYITFDKDVTIITDDNGAYRFGDIYTDDDVTYKEEGWASYPRTFKANRKYWITLSYVTENKPDITDAYASDLFKGIHIEADGNIVDVRNKVSKLYPTVPSYWQTPIDNIIDAVNANAISMATHGDTFVFITDQHWKGNEQISSRLIDYISERVDLSLVVNGGDIIESNNGTKIGAVNEIVDYYKSFKKPHRIFSTIGNHDINTVANSDTSTYLTEDELYPLMIKREEKFTDTKGTPLVTVFDNESQKIRYIQYCYYGQTVNQDTVDMLREAIIEKGAGWTLVIITHAYWLDSSTAETDYTSAILNAMDETDAVVACLLVGHVHDDKTAELTSSGGKSLRIISTSTDSWRQMRSASYVPYTMTPGTTTEQCFDIVQIDTSAKTIKLTRVGVGSDRSYSY